ncbi:uncharacterized protein LOC131884467 [Tigriopus californicus]|uniref:uncharacterized protein LOC131884467 n=1 Tax=Tigriopus californicus TaxID=6832 RepID=UPI0027DA880D|nr:uncharacterized protein LOC131884467 [Tigriopus californicus]
MNQGYNPNNAQSDHGASANKSPSKHGRRRQRPNKGRKKAAGALEQGQQPQQAQQGPSRGVSGRKSTRRRQSTVNPNVFLAVQVSSAIIHENVRYFQESLVERNPKYFYFRVPVPKCHVTLKVFNAPPQHIDSILQAMERAVASNHEPIHLEFDGVNDFDDKVVFAQLTPNPALDALRKKLIKAINRLNVLDHPLTVDKYEPHLTLMKTSRCKDKKLRQMEIDLEHYEDLIHCYFGQESVGSVQLLSMELMGERNGYYFSHGEVHFAEVFESTYTDHSWCCNESFPKPLQEPESSLSTESISVPPKVLVPPRIERFWNHRSIQMIFNPKTLIVASLVALLTWKLRGSVKK